LAEANLAGEVPVQIEPLEAAQVRFTLLRTELLEEIPCRPELPALPCLTGLLHQQGVFGAASTIDRLVRADADLLARGASPRLFRPAPADQGCAPVALGGESG